MIGDELPGRRDSGRHAWMLTARACQTPWACHLEILGAAEWESAGRPSWRPPRWPGQCWLDPATRPDLAASDAVAVQVGAGDAGPGCAGQQGAGREGLAGYQVSSPFDRFASLPTWGCHEMPQPARNRKSPGIKGSGKSIVPSRRRVGKWP